MKFLARRILPSHLAASLIVAAALAACSLASGEPSPLPTVTTARVVQATPVPTLERLLQQASPTATPAPTLEPSVQPSPTATPTPTLEPSVQPSAQPLIPAPLTDPSLDLRAGPVDVPLELQIPSLNVSAPVVGVGITRANVMDAPEGSPSDPVWQKVFWYRGSGMPGDVGTATIAGHVNDTEGRPAVFAHLEDLRPGDLIMIHDTRSSLDIRFTVTDTESYTTQQADDPSVLAQVYGDGPVSGRGPQPAPDGLSHLTLITCTGDWVHGSFDHRLVVYAIRTGDSGGSR